MAYPPTSYIGDPSPVSPPVFGHFVRSIWGVNPLNKVYTILNPLYPLKYFWEKIL